MSAEKDLLSELERLKAENARLKQKLNELGPVESDESKGGVPTLDPIERLDNARIQRFSRQLLLKEIGVKGESECDASFGGMLIPRLKAKSRCLTPPSSSSVRAV